MQKIKDLFNKIVNSHEEEKVKKQEKVVEKIDKEQFKRFYNYYNHANVTNLYKSYDKNPTMTKFFKMNPFIVKVMFDKGVLSMNVDVANSFAMDFLVLVGYFFDNYDEVNNCVWTNNVNLIRKFFELGTEKYLQIGGKTIYDFSEANVKDLVTILLDDSNAREIEFERLCENFYQTRKLSWSKYKKKILEELAAEEQIARVQEITSMDLPLDWDNIFSNSEISQGVYAETSNDGLVLSLNNLGRVDIEYIAEITGKTYKEVILDLKGSIYQNPATWNECFYKGWETADEYLSGNIGEKLHIALEANEKYLGYFSDNLVALDKVKPQMINTRDIYVTIGSPWVPTDIIDDFIVFLFGDWMNNYSRSTDRNIFNTRYDEISGTWEIPHKNRYFKNIANDTIYGTKRIKGIDLLERTLNMKTPSVTDEIKIGNKKKKILNKDETVLIREKQQKLIKTFQDWIWKDVYRRERLIEIYETKFCSNNIRLYDGSFLKFPNMNPNVSLYDYQKNAVARIMFSPNTLLAHDVGAGKTYVMIAAGMEMRRIGTSKKNLFVVPNNLVGQWKNIFEEIYPGSNVLAIEPKKFTPAKRYNVLKDIRDNDYDGIIIAYSCFSLIPLSKRFYSDKISEQIEIIKKRLAKTSKSSKELQKKSKKLEEELLKLQEDYNTKDDWVYFDELGINSMFVDEAHNFKNLPVETKIDHILGVTTSGSSKCVDMMDKIHIVQRQNNGRGVVLATGTPITNSLTDIFVMQKYLQDGQLALLNIQSFDSWVGMFAEKDTNFEIDVDTNNYRMATRFSKYHNMPELSIILSSITDFYQVDKYTGIPKLDGYQDIRIAKTKEFEKYLGEISKRADDIRNRRVSRREDNMLKITTDGRKAALDLRLVDPNSSFTYYSKVVICAENVYRIYNKTKKTKSTQLVFCDSSTPKKEFNLYDELKRVLIMMGVKQEEIAYIHDVVTDAERDKLFKKVQKGEIRILIGSTMKLGLGVNVQDKLIAIHHLDVPWRPADMIQREGRILRRGNENEEVEIYRYITEGSFDAYSWQILEAKQRIIRGILSGSMPKRMCEEVDEAVLNYAEVKAIAIGNPLLKERVEVANELSRNYALQRKLVETRQLLEAELEELPNKIAEQQAKVDNCALDVDFYSNNKIKLSNEERAELRQLIASELASEEIRTTPNVICQYQGFDIIVPNNMIKDKPYIFIEKNGKYYIELGSSEIGSLIRIDNFLDDLENLLNKFNKELDRMLTRKNDIELELTKDDSYIDIIRDLEDKLVKLDNKLGVNKD